MPNRRTTRCAACSANPNNRQYITMWNTITKRKVAGTAAPCPMELESYLRRHEHIVIYNGQDVMMKQKKLRDKESDQVRKQQVGKDTAVAAKPIAKMHRTAGLPQGMNKDAERGLRRKSKMSREKVIVAKPPRVPLGKAHSTAQLSAPLSGVRKPSLMKAPRERDQLATKKGQKTFNSPTPFAAQPPRKSVTLLHPHAYIALAQKVWESEAAHARRLQVDCDEEVEQLRDIRRLHRRYR